MNKTAIITGASSGIGEEYAKTLAGKGYHLVIVARSEDKLNTLAEALNNEHGVNVEVVRADLTKKKDLKTVCNIAKRDDIHMLINNAGVATIGTFTKREATRLEEEISLNITALVMLTHAALPGMVLRNAGHIINVASSAAFQPAACWANYAATKAHVLSLTQALNDEVRGTGVSLQAVCPGPVETGFEHYASDGTLNAPKMLFIKPEQVVKDSLKDLKKGREVSIPAAHHRLIMNTGRILPTAFSRFALRTATRRLID